MKWIALALFASLALLPSASRAQRVLYIGGIAHVDDTSATTWAMSGYEIIHIRVTDHGSTPIMRTETMDARTVEILSRTQAPRLAEDDIVAATRNGHSYILVREYLLAEVTEADAKAAGVSKSELALRWASSVRKVLPKVAPMPSRTGV